MSDEPRLRTADKTPPPYPLGKFPKGMLHIIASEIVYLLCTRGRADLVGDDWERIFAAGIHAEWKPSNIGLDDVRLGACCWGAKTVKSTAPERIRSVRLISGRNSPDFSYSVPNVRDLQPAELGAKVLGIWNTRVSSVRARFAHCRTVVLVKGPDLARCAVFETETIRYEPELFTWTWNPNNNLVGHDEHGHLRFTWQPHGSQFTITEDVPTNRIAFKLRAPEPLPRDATLNALGFDDSWIELLPSL